MEATSIKLTEPDRKILYHTLGLNDDGSGTQYRNYYAANPGDPQIASLADRGLMRMTRKAGDVWPYDYYCVTDDGFRAIGIDRPRS